MPRTQTVIIKLGCCDQWTAVLIDETTGVSFPTKVTATLAEGRDTVLERAKDLAALYLAGDTPQFRFESSPTPE